jgi:hypothetical protein
MNKKTWTLGKAANIPDPRLVIARHIGWSRPLSTETTYTTPEPDNYNYAGSHQRPIDCEFIKDQVFYFDNRSQRWWSVYYVQDEQVTDFLTWAEQQNFEFCWRSYHRTNKLRNRRRILHFRLNSPEQTDNERLFNMGYYDQLQTEFNLDISERLGPPRKNMPIYEQVIEDDYT